MFDQAQVTANLDRELENVTRLLAEAVEAYALPAVKHYSERRDQLLDNRLALWGV